MADELYLIFQKCQDLYKEKEAEWEKHFEWLEDVVRTCKEARNKPILPKTPAPGKKRRKVQHREVIAEDEPKTVAAIPCIPSDPPEVKPNTTDDAPAIIASNTISCTQKRSVERASTHSSDSGVVDDYSKKERRSRSRSRRNDATSHRSSNCQMPPPSIDLKNVPEITATKTASTVDAAIIATEPSDGEVDEQVDLQPKRSTRTKMKTQDKPDNEEQTSVEEKPATRTNVEEKPATRATRTKKRVKEDLSNLSEESDCQMRSTRSKRPKPKQPEESDANLDQLHLRLSDSSDQNVPSSTEEVVMPTRITRSKVKQPIKADPATPVKNGQYRRLMDGGGGGSPFTPSRKNNTKRDGNPASVEELSASIVQVKVSPVKIVKHLDSAAKQTTTKSSTARKLKQYGGSYQTPSPSLGMNRHKLLTKGLSAGTKHSTAKLGHQSSAFSPQYKMVRTPSDLSRPANLVTSMTSFITRVQPAKNSKEEMEERKEREMRIKREREDVSQTRKAELIRMKAEEQKRKNEERMKRVQEKREAKERAEGEARMQQEKERRIREEKQRETREKEEKERRRKQLEAKKEDLLRKQKEEEARAERARQEEEARQRLLEREEAARIEKLAREEEQRRILQMNQKILEQKRAKEKAAALAYHEQQEKNRILREKHELNQIKAREAQRESQEVVVKNSGGEAQKENAALNSTYTKDANQITSYAMTPAPPPPPNPNNYNINDLKSDQSTDDEGDPKKPIPKWAQGSELKKGIIMQFSSYGHQNLRLQDNLPPCYIKKDRIDLNRVFPPEQLLRKDVELTRMFKKQRPNFTVRGSSAQWHTPPHKYFACEGAADSFIADPST